MLLKPATTYGGASAAIFTVSVHPANVTASRLSPAVLIDSSATEVTFGPPGAAGSSGPVGSGISELAFVMGGKVTVRSVGELAGELVLDEPWLLAWFGPHSPLRGFPEPFDVEVPGGGVNKDLVRGATGQRLDLPVLIRLEHRPQSLSAGAHGLRISFARAAGKIAVMPLFGGRVFLPEETADWAQALPKEVLAQCRLWSAKLRDVPPACAW